MRNRWSISLKMGHGQDYRTIIVEGDLPERRDFVFEQSLSALMQAHAVNQSLQEERLQAYPGSNYPVQKAVWMRSPDSLPFVLTELLNISGIFKITLNGILPNELDKVLGCLKSNPSLKMLKLTSCNQEMIHILISFISTQKVPFKIYYPHDIPRFAHHAFHQHNLALEKLSTNQVNSVTIPNVPTERPRRTNPTNNLSIFEPPHKRRKPSPEPLEPVDYSRFLPMAFMAPAHNVEIKNQKTLDSAEDSDEASPIIKLAQSAFETFFASQIIDKTIAGSLLREIARFHRKNLGTYKNAGAMVFTAKDLYERAILLGNEITKVELDYLIHENKRFISKADHYNSQKRIEQSPKLAPVFTNNLALIEHLRELLNDYLLEMDTIYFNHDMKEIMPNVFHHLALIASEGRLALAEFNDIPKQNTLAATIFTQAEKELIRLKSQSPTDVFGTATSMAP